MDIAGACGAARPSVGFLGGRGPGSGRVALHGGGLKAFGRAQSADHDAARAIGRRPGQRNDARIHRVLEALDEANEENEASERLRHVPRTPLWREWAA